MTRGTQPAPKQKGSGPTGYNTLTPYITSRQASEMVEFVKQAFGATERMRMPAGGGVHVELLIGDSLLMMGGGEALHGDPVHAALHLYVPDADAVYRQAPLTPESWAKLQAHPQFAGQ